jgi:signal transduction histidine kinase
VLTENRSNAVKFTPAGGVIHLRASADEAGKNVRISVGDSGPGVPKDFRASLFQRFQQAQTSDTRSHTGTGLGLSIVRDFAELHGGTVVCAEEAAPEGGALFVVTLPLLAPSGTDLEGTALTI